MTSEVDMKKVLTELVELRKEVHFIKTHMFNSDAVMTKEEEAQYKESVKELDEGKTTSLDDLEKDI